MKALVFSGTSEGKAVIKYLSELNVDTTVCVATEYGSYVMDDMSNVNINVGRLDINEMLAFIEQTDIVIDATHPYAQAVTKNIKLACGMKNVEYLRLLRDEIEADKVVYVNNIDEATEFLNNNEGNIFVSTGSNEIEKYTKIQNYQSRLTARVLPTKEAYAKLNNLGITNAVYEKGPFSYEQNLAALKGCNAKWLVTKSSGSLGGFKEKLDAARDNDTIVIVIKRPKEEGYDFEEVKKIICKRIKEI